MKFIFYYIFFIFFKYSFNEINDNFKLDNSLDEGYILDIKNYHNLTIMLTTSKNIYKGIPPNPEELPDININNYSSVVTCNNNYILIACLDDYLLSKINLNTLIYTPLLSYSDIDESLEAPSNICSLSMIDNIVYIAFSQPSTSSTTKIYIKVIKIILNSQNDLNNGPIIDNKINFTFPKEYEKYNYDRHISCEPTRERKTNAIKLICIFQKKSKTLYSLFASVINDDFNDFAISEKGLLSSPTTYSRFKVYSYKQQYVRIYSFDDLIDLYLENDEKNNLKLKGVRTIENFKNYHYSSYNDMHDYHNEYIAIVGQDTHIQNMVYYSFFVYRNDSKDYYKITDYEITSPIEKMIIYYYENDDTFICYYQTSNKKIKYFYFSGIKSIYYLKQTEKTIQIVSQEQVEYNVGNLIEDSNIGTLEVYYFYSANSMLYRYYGNNFIFPYNTSTKILSPTPSDNDWLTFKFCYRKVDINYLGQFVFNTMEVKIQYCAYPCAKCSTSFSRCDTCKKNYFPIRDSEDKLCYFASQILKGYVYNSTTQYFEQCYPTCEFCSIKLDPSDINKQNCYTCKEGYYHSYIDKGNCYPKNEINTLPCEENKLRIVSTGECVSECPQTTNYYIYNYTFINFTIDKGITRQYEPIKDIIPSNALGNLCYEECPDIPNLNEIQECECLYEWYYNEKARKLYCVFQKYCTSNELRYYVDDTGECLENGCPEGYFQFNFECYKNGCPINTNQSSSEPYICKSIYNYCHINKYFQTICYNNKSNEYIYQFENTNQYLKSCNESLIYTIQSSESYLVNGFCYLDYPEDTTMEEENNESQTYEYYNDENDYKYNKDTIIEECNNKIRVIDTLECLNSLDECIEKKYKIFYSDCYSKECPGLSILGKDGYYCICNLSNDDNICPEDLIYKNNYICDCVEFCSIYQLLNNTCRIINIVNHIKEITDNMKNIVYDFDNLKLNYTDDIIIEGNHIFYEIQTSLNSDFNYKTSKIDLKEIEKELKEYYNIDHLLIFKYDINLGNKTIVEYSIFNPYNKSKLDLSPYENRMIDIYLPRNLSEDLNKKYLDMKELGYNILNINDDLFNDFCLPFSDENYADMLLSDRRKTFFNEELLACEDGCFASDYVENLKIVKCECHVKIREIEIIKFDKTDLNSFFNIKTYANFKVLQCYKLLLNKNGYIINYGCYILTFIIIIFN